MSHELLITQDRKPRFIEKRILVVPLDEFDIKVAVASDLKDGIRLRSKMNTIGSTNGFKPNRLPNGRVVLLSGSDVDMYPFDKPYKTESGAESDAIYLFRYQNEITEFLVQYLGPRENNNMDNLFSASFHGGHGLEFFGVLDGTLYISDGTRAKKLTRGQLIVLPENEDHICYSLGGSAITGILKLGDLSHKWYRKPKSRELIRQASLLD